MSEKKVLEELKKELKSDIKYYTKQQKEIKYQMKHHTSFWLSNLEKRGYIVYDKKKIQLEKMLTACINQVNMASKVLHRIAMIELGLNGGEDE